MNSFPGIDFGLMPRMLPLGTNRDTKLLDPLIVIWSTNGKLEVPKGFIHDGPSIPNRLRGLIYYTHRLLCPSIEHDYLCKEDMWTQKLRSRFLLEALEAEGVGFIRRKLMWSAVRAGSIGGWG